MVSGATGYTVRRSLRSGGPYGILATGVAVLNFNDTNVQNGITYYYVVNVEWTTLLSVDSNEAGVISSDRVSLQVPVELIDRGLLSNMTNTTFQRSKTSLDTHFYDGALIYTWQIVAQNFDSSPVQVHLVNSALSVVGTISIPSGTSALTRLVSTFTPTVGEGVYQIRIDGTTNTGDVLVNSARLLITQTNATKTRIYIPLLASAMPASEFDLDGFIEETNAQTYQELPSAGMYRRNTTVLSALKDFNAWEFETITAVTGATTRGSVALINQNTNQNVSRTQGLFSSTSMQLIRSPFDEGVTNFSSVNENHYYQPSVRCEFNCTTGKVRIYKSGLWVNLESLTQAEIYFRTSLGSRNLGLQIDTSERTSIDSTLFRNPVAFFQTVGSVASASTSQVTLLSHGTQESGTIGTSDAALPLDIMSLGKIQARTSLIVLSPTGTTYILKIDPGAAQFKAVDTSLVIRIKK
ncbi:MAG: hypothetical protein H7235_11440 [Bdellovibrionaceae bacterium]|nr:hypothetical protein [Pseudobdellovibrionaceae bacterium]